MEFRFAAVGFGLTEKNRFNDAQAPDQAWCAETTWQDNRLVVAHDPQAAARRAQARDKTIEELVAMGQQCKPAL